MRVNVLFFGMLRDVTGKSSESVELANGATLKDLVSHFEASFPKIRDLMPSLALSLNQEYAGLERELRNGDEVGMLPPVSGGVDHDGRPEQRAAIVREPIDTQNVLAGMKQGSDGAAVVFEGVVRNQTRGRQTRYLEYEAYEAMALKQMGELVEQARKQFAVRDAVVVHRLGRLEIGEVSVLIIVASAHRAAAFDACRWLIDTLKKTVPIWKKEFFVDGAVWADGEPFPEEIQRPEGSPKAGTASK